MISKYYKQFHVNKLNNLDEMGKFLESYKKPKHTQEETDNINSPISIKEIDGLKTSHRENSRCG